MNIVEAQKILDDLHNRYPHLKNLDAFKTAAFVRTLPPDDQKPIEAAAKVYERQYLASLNAFYKAPLN